MHDVPLAVTEDLYFDVTSPLNVLLHKDGGLLEQNLALLARCLKVRNEILLVWNLSAKEGLIRIRSTHCGILSCPYRHRHQTP
jgi:hypothetical protein